jgi:polysaccharide export outer membrane protein
MTRFFVLVATLFFCFAFLSSPCFSAQSTADVPASSEFKRSARTEILGKQSDIIAIEEEYVIGHGDILSVSVYGEGDMAASMAASTARPDATGDMTRGEQKGVKVMMDGRVSLLHIGDVEVVGMTLTQLADYLKKLYATIYDDPIITTTLVQSNSLRYTVMGNVTQPGIFYLDHPISIVQTIARSGGFTEWANKEITVVRENVKKGDEQLFKGNSLLFDYDDFISGKDLLKNISIRSGDTIVVH